MIDVVAGLTVGAAEGRLEVAGVGVDDDPIETGLSVDWTTRLTRWSVPPLIVGEVGDGSAGSSVLDRLVVVIGPIRMPGLRGRADAGASNVRFAPGITGSMGRVAVSWVRMGME